MPGRVVIVGLGPAGPELVTTDTVATIERIPHRWLRTARHPSATLLADAPTFDDLYDTSSSFEEVYAAIVATVVDAAARHCEVLYAVPGSPLVAERTVELLRADGRVAVTILPALSYLDLAWAALGVDPLATGVRLVDGRRFAVEAAGASGPLLVAQCDSRAVLSDVKLAVDDDAEPGAVTVLQRLGLADQAVFEVAWDDLDRAVEPDHLTTLWIPSLEAPVGRELVRFHELVRTLREQCPWDREQTHRSLTSHLVEETYEVVDAIESGDDDHLAEELGDLLFQIEFHAVIAEQEGRFTMADVARTVHDKLVHRHPHVFVVGVGREPAEARDEAIVAEVVIRAGAKPRVWIRSCQRGSGDDQDRGDQREAHRSGNARAHSTILRTRGARFKLSRSCGGRGVQITTR